MILRLEHGEEYEVNAIYSHKWRKYRVEGRRNYIGDGVKSKLCSSLEEALVDWYDMYLIANKVEVEDDTDD